ncbi:efflux RND transporter permease subunit [Streptomyces acidiscabies]|uniref:Efflux RND transporter permease subunit n=1 Tax=Streptomyces acidiscabies TaxID=42234 RepID=A0AAP6EL61_9ACTN|nr:efflux RND transporter permease subunit [Streptomyces acidiscabies]MBP5940128.1 efflux RND transporter permease subunit [Streptomyces sp. LBUM 1476]MBZ3911335.1 efflux RND transporter permease subunit [Streptomyces acidiscabies]MDX2966291.1 efflux RND transporter permease subunit [Streptomyces acidiscabies]MDX3025701.1 efflux RND transporter permease subunit [Streptomyces acidiscabies]MDX3796290.1 efflux RND transporter permease subunit [Streptomyces acidiscabies]
MSWLSRFSLAQRALIGLMSLVALVFGLIAIPQLKQQLLPTIELPMVSVIAPYQGASPDVVEKQVVEPIENNLEGVDGITGVTSTASEGNAVIMASFDYGNDTKRIVADVQQAVNRARAGLPDAVDPQVVAGSTDDIPTVVLAVTSAKDQQALADQLDSTVVPALRDIDGVGQVTVTGVRDLRVTITPDDAKLAAAGLNVQSLAKALQAGGVTLPGGSFDEAGANRTVQIGGGYTSVRQIADLRIPVPGKAPVKVADIAAVREAEAPADSITRTDGKPSLAVSVTMAHDGSAVTVSNAVEDKLPALRKDLGAEITVVSDQGPAVSKSIKGLTTEGGLGLLFAVIVILVFLASIRSTLVTAVSIPLSVVLALIVLWTRDLSLNMLTLGALTIAIGRVVDDSIVVLENIKRHLGYGEERQTAILTAVREVAGAVTSSTLTTVAVFLPIGLVGGMVGALFGSFSLTVTAALLASLLVSLTVVPVMSFWFLRAPKGTPEDAAEARRIAEEKEENSRLQKAYVPVLRFATRRRLTSVAIAVVVLLGTFGMAPLLKTNFFDQGEQQVLTVKQELKPGTSLAATDAEAKKVEALLADTEGVKDYQVTIGSSGFLAAFGGATDSNQASYQVMLEDSASYDTVQKRVEDGIKKLDGAGTVTVSAGDGFGAQDLSVVVKASDGDTLRTASEEVRKAVASLDDVTDVTSDLSQSVPRISVKANAKAAAAGFDDQSLGMAVAQAVRGTTAAKAVLDDTERDVVITSAKPAKTLAELRSLSLGAVKLGDVATVQVVDGPVSMTRIDGQRAATITAKPTGDNTGAVSTALQSKIDALKLPEGARAEIGGVSSDQDSAFKNLGLAMLAAIAIVFMLLVATFRSLVQPLILLVSIPFAATGAIGLLLITGTPMGVPAMIGMLMLIGIVVTNAIVLIDLINQYRSQGYGVVEAVVEGGRHRLRPILMTALATIFALLPMALGVTGEGGFISQPLAVVVIGGLITSTLLTLLLVPTLYAMLELRKERRAAKKAAKNGEAADPVKEPEPAGV